MASQWGRESSFQSGGKRRGGAITLFGLILALALGGAGGYGAFRLTQPDMNAAVEDARADAAELRRSLAATLQELDEARAALASSAERIDELEAKSARQAGELDAMAERLSEITAAAPPADDAGTRQLEVLAAARDTLVAENERLKAGVAELEAEREAAGRAANAREQRLADELAQLRDEILPELTDERDRLQGRVLDLLADRDALKAEVDATAGANGEDVRRILELESLLAETARELSAAKQALAAREAERAESPAQTERKINSDPAEAPETADATNSTELVPRDPEAVATALRAAPGLGFLSDQDRRTLTSMLEDGECVTSALEAVFERVPILTLRNLIRDLNSDC